MRIHKILSSTLLLSFFVCLAAGALSDMDLTAGTDLRLLELKFFEHTFDKEPSEDRVERIERLVKGEVGQGNPADRIKDIAADLQADGESLSPAQDHDLSRAPVKKKQSAVQSGNAAATETSDNTSSVDRGDYPKVTNLEKEILKQTFPGQTLPARLARLETSAFGSPSASTDLGARTDILESYAEQTLHDKPFGVNPNIDKTYILASTPPAAAGLDAKQAIEHFFNSTRRLSDEFSDRSTLRTPMGQPGPLSQEEQVNDDPQAYAKEPPPPNARMITRVAWCEVQTFGHTFPNMHLTRRLRQLSDELIPKISKQSDMQLMDDLDPIEKAVIARKSGKPGSSAKAPGVKMKSAGGSNLTDPIIDNV